MVIMNQRLLKWILCCLLPLMLIGCGSSRKSVRSGGSGRIVASNEVKPSGSQTNTEGGSAELIALLKGIADPMARDLLTEAGTWIGTQYVYGGETRAGTDCSGLVMSLYRDVCGVKIPRTTRDQVRYCTQIARNRLVPGDLIFFGRGASPDSVSHVGMYIGDGRMVHASSSRGVIVSSFDSGYWAERYTTGARVDSAPMAYAATAKFRGEKATPSPAQPLPILNPAESLPVAPIRPAATPEPMHPQRPIGTPEVILVNIDETTTQPPVTEGPSIDLLDMIISAKLDSIVSAL